jgi:uncharacterized protein (DUF58 family)
VETAELVFPLVPRTRLQGLPFGGLPSWRRGLGSDLAGSRPYRPGDDIALIDWASSARLSAVQGRDEFVVREFHAAEAPRVVIVADRRPAMALYPPGLPFLRKKEALQVSATMISVSTAAARGLLGYVDFGDGDAGKPFWVAPRSRAETWQIEERIASDEFRAPENTLELAVEWLVRERHALSRGSFVFVVSDFLAGPPLESWLVAVEHGWDVVAVVVQDPVWEQSFPELPGLVLPLADPATGRSRAVRLSRAEARARRERNECRLASLMDDLAGLGLDAIVLGVSDPPTVNRLFEMWAEERAYAGGHA